MNPGVSADTFLRELALAVARNEVGANNPLPAVLAQEGITQAEYDAVRDNPMYLRYLGQYKRDLVENGFSFSAKCRVLAEELLPNLYHIAQDSDQPAAARVRAVESLVTWADLVPKKTADVQAGPGFSITINLPGAQSQTFSSPATPADVVDVAATPQITIPSFPTPSLEVGVVKLLEPIDYEYAGDDVVH